MRDCGSFGLHEFVRFSVRKPEENEVLIEAFREVENVFEQERGNYRKSFR